MYKHMEIAFINYKLSIGPSEADILDARISRWVWLTGQLKGLK